MGARYLKVFSDIDWTVRVNETEAIQISQIESGGLITSVWREVAGPDSSGVLRSRDGKKVVVYIPESNKKFHFTDCSTLKKMTQNGRFDRYVVARGRSKIFRIDIGLYSERNENLEPCMYCLNNTFYGQKLIREFRTTDLAKSKFDMETWLELDSDNTLDRVPRFDEYSAPKNAYTSDFQEISRKARSLARFKCSLCKADLSEQMLQKYLHVHHINGIKSDNSSFNLKVVCIKCHAELPSHSHIRALPEYKEYLRIKG